MPPKKQQQQQLCYGKPIVPTTEQTVIRPICYDFSNTSLNRGATYAKDIMLGPKMVGSTRKPKEPERELSTLEKLELLIEKKASTNKVRKFFIAHVQMLNEESKENASFKDSFDY